MTNHVDISKRIIFFYFAKSWQRFLKRLNRITRRKKNDEA
jgi:hypothetical protein